MPLSVVRRIRRQRARGDTLAKIANDLNEAGVPTARAARDGIPPPCDTFCSERRRTRSYADGPPPRTCELERGLLSGGSVVGWWAFAQRAWGTGVARLASDQERLRG